MGQHSDLVASLYMKGSFMESGKGSQTSYIYVLNTGWRDRPQLPRRNLFARHQKLSGDTVTLPEVKVCPYGSDKTTAFELITISVYRASWRNLRRLPRELYEFPKFFYCFALTRCAGIGANFLLKLIKNWRLKVRDKFFNASGEIIGRSRAAEMSIHRCNICRIQVVADHVQVSKSTSAYARSSASQFLYRRPRSQQRQSVLLCRLINLMLLRQYLLPQINDRECCSNDSTPATKGTQPLAQTVPVVFLSAPHDCSTASGLVENQRKKQRQKISPR